MFEKLVRLLARRHAKLKHWHAVCVHLKNKNEKLARFWHVGTEAR